MSEQEDTTTDSVSAADAVFDFETSTLVIVLIPVMSVITCMCCVACIAWYCGKCPSILQKCPAPLRKCCIYDEEDEEEEHVPEDQKRGLAFASEAARQALQARGAWVLDVLIIRAQNLPRLDWAINDRNLVGTSDPFVQLRVLEDRSSSHTRWKRTWVKRGTLHPEYGQSFRFHLAEGIQNHNPKLALEVWDWDRFKRNDFSGKAEVPLASQLSHASAAKPSEDFMWLDLAWRDGSPVLGGSARALRSQVQLRVRVTPTRSADAIMAERRAGRTRVKEGLLGGPEARLEGLNLSGTRRGVLGIDPEHVLHDALRAAVEAKDREEISRLLAAGDAGGDMDQGDVRVARQQLRVIAAEEAKSTLLERRQAARLGLGVAAYNPHDDDDESEGDSEGAGDSREALVELGGKFARGEIGKEEYLAAKQRFGGKAPTAARLKASAVPTKTAVDPSHIRIEVAPDHDVATPSARGGGSGAGVFDQRRPEGPARHSAAKGHGGSVRPGGLLSDRREFGGRGPSSLPAAGAAGPGRALRRRAEGEAHGGVPSKGESFAPGPAGGAGDAREGRARAGIIKEGSTSKESSGRLGSLAGSGRWHGGHRAGAGEGGVPTAPTRSRLLAKQKKVVWGDEGEAGPAGPMPVQGGSQTLKRDTARLPQIRPRAAR